MRSLSTIPLAEARKRAIDELGKRRLNAEEVALPQALARILATDIWCTEDIPFFNRSTVDGFAVCATDTASATDSHPVTLHIVGEVRMGRTAATELGSEQAMRVPTGGMLPDVANAVVMQEQVDGPSTDGQILVRGPVRVGENLIWRGEDAKADERLLVRGRRIEPADLGVLASCGVVKVPVVRRPRVFLIGTGDEIVDPSVQPKLGQVRDVNTYTLGAMARVSGCDVTIVPRVPDRLEALVDTLKDAVRTADVVLVSGGSSVGDRDFTMAAVMQLPAAELIFHGIALKPGKPAALAHVGTVCLFGIPGHIVSAMTVFREIIEPALSAMTGETTRAGRFSLKAVLTATLCPPKDRDEFFYVRLRDEAGMKTAIPITGKSGWVTLLSRADGWVFLPAGHIGLEPGAEVDVELLTGCFAQKWWED